MVWEWSHSPEAYENLLINLRNKPKQFLLEAYVEFEVTDEHGNFDSEAYELLYKEKFAMSREALVSCVYEAAEMQSSCESGGFEAWVCPHGCHLVSFDEAEDDDSYYY